MNFTHYDLGRVNAGATVVVELDGTEANVLLLDSTNFAKYQRRDQYRYFGGHATRSPYPIGVPHSAHWHVVIDLGGFGGSVRSSVRVIP